MAPPKVILFDVNETLLDLQPTRERISKMLNAGPEVARLWFTTLLQHALVTTVADRYADFAVLGAACLRMVAKTQGFELSDADAQDTVAMMQSLPAHADVAPALQRFRDAGFRLATLTNSSNAAVAAQMEHAGLTEFFELLLSVEDVGRYKPHGEVYRWAASRVGAELSDCLMVAAHGWDVAGAAWVGMQTAFIARPGQSVFPLGPEPDLVVPSLAELADALGVPARRTAPPGVPNRATFEELYAGKAPWDTGRPQPGLLAIADQITGTVLDAGCGTGENALFLAGRGCTVTGIDFLEEPIRRAQQKAAERGLTATFLVKDALTLADWDQRFDAVIDSGLLHVFSDEDRRRYVEGLAAVLRPGGRLFLLCFSDAEPGTQGPRRVREDELRTAFAHRWHVETLRPTRFEVRPDLKGMEFSPGGPTAWLATVRRE